MNDQFRPTFGATLFIFGFLVVAMGISVLWLDIPVHVTLIMATVVAIGILMIQGYKWESVLKAIEYGGKLAITPALTLYVIGMVIGSWIASGTVPMIIFWGLKLISPSIFLVTACLVCSVISFATGSSWSTGGTVGVALMGVGVGLGINPAMTAGAIISGAFLGDKMSPLSDTTNLAPAVAEADLFDHIKSMAYTTIPGFIITLFLYGVIGLRYSEKAVDFISINATLDAIQHSFSISPIVLIPPILVIVLAIRKIPALPTLISATLVAAAIAVFLQGETITTITAAMNSGFVSNTGIESVDKLLSRGGLQSMNWTASLGLIGIVYGGILEKSNVLTVFLEKIKAFTKTTGSLVFVTVLTLIGLNFATASQYMTIVLGGRMFIAEYKEKDLLPQTLSRTLEDAGTLTSPLVPWGLCGVFFAGTLGVPTMSYAPYAFLCWIVPIISVVYGFLNKFQWKTGDIVSAKTYRDVEDVNV